MGPPSTIDSVLQASKNTSANQSKALRSEFTALTHFLQKNHRLLYHRKKIFGVEVDLVLHDADGVVQFLEVKSYTSDAMMGYRLTEKQKARLIYAKAFFESCFGLPTQVVLVLVKAGKVDVIVVG